MSDALVSGIEIGIYDNSKNMRREVYHCDGEPVQSWSYELICSETKPGEKPFAPWGYYPDVPAIDAAMAGSKS